MYTIAPFDYVLTYFRAYVHLRQAFCCQSNVIIPLIVLTLAPDHEISAGEPGTLFQAPIGDANIMDWRLKIAGEKVIGAIPGALGKSVHWRIQQRFSAVYIGNKEKRAHEVRRSLGNATYLAQKLGYKFDGSRMLELGTGWHGTDIICMHIAGVEEIWTCDLVPHLDEGLVFWMLDGFDEVVDELADTCNLDAERIRERLQTAKGYKTLDAFLQGTKTNYIAPCLFHEVEFPDDFFDLFFSYSVLQRVPVKDLIAYLEVAAKALRTGGHTLNVIHHADHHARHDKGLYPLDYLQYSDSFYNALQSKKLNFQNRLRHGEFVALLESAGLHTVDEVLSGEDAEQFRARNIKLDKRFKDTPVEDLVITRTQVLSQKQ